VRSWMIRRSIAAKEELSKTRQEFAASIENAKKEIQKDLDDAAASTKRIVGMQETVALILIKMQRQGEAQDPTAALALAKASQPTSKETPAKAQVHIALVAETKEVGMSDLGRVTTALQKLVSRDLKPIWNVDATVEAYKSMTEVPAGYWPVIIKDDIGVQGARGMHLVEKDGQAFAMVEYDKGDEDSWTVTASHELVDMLVDPFGNRTISAPSPNPADNGKEVDILVEIAQPVEGKERGHRIDGVLVTDFVTPAFYTKPGTVKPPYSLK